MSLPSLFLLAMLALVATPSYGKVKRPATDFFTICHRSDPGFHDCVQKNIEDLRPRLIAGIPELGIPPIDPYLIPRIEVSEGVGNFRFSQALHNITMLGLGKYDLKDIHIKFNKTTAQLKVKLFFPVVTMKANCVNKGRILAFPINGRGTCDYKLIGLTADVTCYAKQVTRRGGKEYYDVTHARFVTSVRDIVFHFDNLLGANRALNDNMNEFFNENKFDVYNNYKTVFELAFGEFFRNEAKLVFDKYPIHELLPE